MVGAAQCAAHMRHTYTEAATNAAAVAAVVGGGGVGDVASW